MRFPAGILTAMLILAGVTACKEGTDSLPAGRTAGRATPPPVQEEPATLTPKVNCKVGSIEIVEMSKQRFLSDDKAQALLKDRVNRHFPPDSGGTGPLTLYVQYAVRKGDADPDTFYFGAKGFLKGPGNPLPVVLEADGRKDGPVPDACRLDMAGPMCAGQIADRLAEPAIELLVRRLSCVCKLHAGDEKQVRALFTDSDPWVRGQAAMRAGEGAYTALVEDLERLVSDENADAAAPAIGALGRLKSERSLPVLIKRAHRADEIVTRAVAVALGDINTPESRRYLETWAASHPIESIRALASELLAE